MARGEVPEISGARFWSEVSSGSGARLRRAGFFSEILKCFPERILGRFRSKVGSGASGFRSGFCSGSAVRLRSDAGASEVLEWFRSKVLERFRSSCAARFRIPQGSGEV